MASWRRIAQEAIARQPWCTWCGSRSDLTGDHVTPRHAGGLNTRANVQVLCRTCNSRKGTWTPRWQLTLGL